MKISLILPYWDRQEAANKALALIEKTYDGLNLELVVVDDGNKVPFVMPKTQFAYKVVTLPRKDEPKCPSTAWNEGVAASTGEIIVLSCIEILHDTPVLEQLAENVQDLGSKGYVLAAAWCPESSSWHCHSTVKVPRNPSGTGIAFCGAMHRELYFEADGFGEEYREGAGYEDNDFINRMLKVGARFVIRDDLVVTHPKTGATIEWGAGKFDRNEKIFYEKWPETLRNPKINFVCLNVDNYCGRGADYVNTLFDMVRRNMSPHCDAAFSCLTDNGDGLHPLIKVIPLPKDIKGWWGKLYLFKDGLFPARDRVIYFDLDTLIVSNIDDIIAYDGDFAILRDFLSPQYDAPAVMSWKAGLFTDLWEKWNSNSRPNDVMGDWWWFNKLRVALPKYDILQDLFPNKFVSYKQNAITAPPLDSAVVCFHGLPRPHEVSGWVADVWKIDGLSTSDLKVVNNVNDDVIIANIKSSSILDIPWLEMMPVDPNNYDTALLVGGAPSLQYDIEAIREKQKQGASIFALNGAAYYLATHGITADYCVIIDARESNAKFIDKCNKVGKYFLASQCNPKLFDLAGNNATLFHIDIPYLGSYVPGERQIQAVGGGVTVGLIAMSVAYTQGFRKLHLYGYDSSYLNDQHHAYNQCENDGEPVLTAHVNGREFKAAPWMIVQVNQFQNLAKQLLDLDVEITVHGTGLLPTVAWEMAHNKIAV